MIRLGILGCADIAYRRFLPALSKSKEFHYVGHAVAAYDEWDDNVNRNSESFLEEKLNKAKTFTDQFGGKTFIGYKTLLASDEIDAVYIPLPPSLHYKWAKAALIYGKHVLLEKPCTTNIRSTEELVQIAENSGLVLLENYAFAYHRQIDTIKELMEGELGDIRLIRAFFGFPHRENNDFRYKKSMGGGALLDCGGYTVKIVQILLGKELEVATSILHGNSQTDVDLYGSAVLINKKGQEAQLAFGMDNAYKCELEVWGSKATLFAPRIFTPPADYEPKIIIKGQVETEITVKADDQFYNAIQTFSCCIQDSKIAKENRLVLLQQSKIVQQIFEKNILEMKNE